jgi:8-oxo-dGTP pyrophosphatase MutT (NUDIX family)
VKNTKYKSRTAWQCRSWRLRVLEFAYPDGSVKERGVIDHPGSVVMVPMDGENVRILRQYRIALKSTILELPAGTKEPEEDWLVCARRELREETGYRADQWTRAWWLSYARPRTLGLFLILTVGWSEQASLICSLRQLLPKFNL